MDFRIIELTSASEVKVRSANAVVIVPTEQYIALEADEVGFFEGRYSDHQKGIYMQGGIINPLWCGYATAELAITGEIDIKVGQKVAHAIIMKSKPD